MVPGLGGFRVEGWLMVQELGQGNSRFGPRTEVRFERSCVTSV